MAQALACVVVELDVCVSRPLPFQPLSRRPGGRAFGATFHRTVRYGSPAPNSPGATEQCSGGCSTMISVTRILPHSTHRYTPAAPL